MNLKQVLFSSIIFAAFCFFTSCDDKKTSDQIFQMQHFTYLLEQGAAKEIKLPPSKNNTYKVIPDKNFDDLMRYRLAAENPKITLFSTQTDEISKPQTTGITVQVDEVDVLHHTYFKMIIFPKGQLILYPYTYQTYDIVEPSKKVIKMKVDDVIPQFFLNGKEDFTATSSNTDVVEVSIAPRLKSRMSIASVLPESEINPNWSVPMIAISVGKADLTIKDSEGRVETITVEVSK